MKKITTLLLLVIATPFAYGASSSDERLECVADHIVNNCESGIIWGNCNSLGTKNQITCKEELKNEQEIRDYLKKYEAKNNFLSIGTYSSLDPILACSIGNNEGIWLQHPTKYTWNNTDIECPKEDIYYAETHGDYSPATAGKDNDIRVCNTSIKFTWGGGGFLLGVLTSVVTWMRSKYKKRKK